MFVQDNQNCSCKDVLRDQHYQRPAYAQGKLVCCVRGTVFDVVVGIQENLPVFGCWIYIELIPDNDRKSRLLFDFLCGYLMLSEILELFYQTVDYLSALTEQSLIWNDSHDE